MSGTSAGNRPEVIAFEVVRAITELRRWPVPIIVSVFTTVGGRICSKASRASAQLISAPKDAHRRPDTWRTSNGHLHRRHRECRAARRPPNGGPSMFGIAIRIVARAHDDVASSVSRQGPGAFAMWSSCGEGRLEFVGLGRQRLLRSPSACSCLAARRLIPCRRDAAHRSLSTGH